MSDLNYMNLDDAIFSRFAGIDWFSKCAQPPDASTSVDVIWADDWTIATKYYSDPEWENTTLEARNSLTTHLAKRHPKEYQEWNKLVREAKAKLEANIFKIAQEFQQQARLAHPFLDCFKWDVLGIVMEETYSRFRPPILFFRHLERVYEAGRFPCGWKGAWPNGCLIVI